MTTRMGRPKIQSFVDKATMARAERDLARLRRNKIYLQLLSIIFVGRGWTLEQVADGLKISRQTVATWVRRYKTEGLDGLAAPRKPRSGGQEGVS